MKRVMGTSALRVEVSGIDGITKALRPWLEPQLTRELDTANKKAANEMAKQLRSELKPVSAHMAKAVRVHRAKTGKPGWIVGGRRKIAFFWHMVIGGTKAHGPRKAKALTFIPGWEPRLGAKPAGAEYVRTAHVRGVAARPLVEEVARRYGERVLDGIDRDMSRVTGT